jgi:aminomethyltransferase
MTTPRRHTPYYDKFIALGAQLGDRMGFDAAVVFTSTQDEHLATREAAGIYDVYYQGPIDIKGPDAEALLQRVSVRDVATRMDDGVVLYTSMCNEAGGILDDLTVYRLSAEHFWIVATPSRAGVIETHLRERARELRAYVTNLVSGTAYLSIQGPNSRALLSDLAPEADLSTAALPYFRFVQTVVAGVPMLLSRTGYSGELGYELYYPRDYASHVWDAVLAAGRGAKPAGLGALRSTRMEKKYPLYGLDLTEETTPLEAGLAWAVDLDHGGGFIGREALLRQREAGITRELVGISFADTSFMPAIGDAIATRDGAPLGAITSADTGWFLGRNLAMGYISSDTPDGAEVDVGHGGRGTVTRRAFYDPDRTRVRA